MNPHTPNPGLMGGAARPKWRIASPERVNRLLLDLGWVTLIHRVLRGKPSSSFALSQLMSNAGKVVTYDALIRGYADFHLGGGLVLGCPRGRHGDRLDLATRKAISRRIGRLRATLDDLGLSHVIETADGGYTMSLAARQQLEMALLEASGLGVVAS